MRGVRAAIVAMVALLPALATCHATGPTPAATLAPDAGRRAVARTGMVSSAHPAASEAGIETLRRGGNAVDAAVAAAFAIGVVEPQMSGLGGGGAMLIWLGSERRAEYLDFYSAQPAAAFRDIGDADPDRPNLRTVAVPGQAAGLLAAHERFGRLSRAEVVAPAIRLAEQGFPVNQVLAQAVASDSAKLSRFPDAWRVFWPGGRPLEPGQTLRQPELAVTLRRVAEEGRSGFYAGEVAQALVRVLRDGGHPAGLEELAAYEPQWKRPLCIEYRDWLVLSAPPPQTGLVVLHALKLLEPHDLAAAGLPTRSPAAFDILVSALRVGAAANRHNSDPNWATVPAVGITSEEFARRRAPLVGTGRAPERIEPGPDPLEFDDAPPPARCAPLVPYGPARALAAVPALEGAAEHAGTVEHGNALAHAGAVQHASAIAFGGETTHLSVVDGGGNAVALTQTNSSLFGSGARAAGFFLNDSGFNFDRSRSAAAGRSPWRIRNSTIAPTIVIRDGRAHLVVGSPGGGRIPPAIIQSIVYALDYGMDPLEALRMPRVFPSPASPRVETEHGFGANVLARAREMGYRTTPDAAGYARVYMIVRNGDRWIGAADPRHDGEARGY